MNQVQLSQRGLALIIDIIVALLPCANLWLIAVLGHWPVLRLVDIIIFVAFVMLRDSIFMMQSIGKRIMMYQVVYKNNTALRYDFRVGLLRNSSLLILPVDIIRLLLGEQRLGDKWAGTRLIQHNESYRKKMKCLIC
jgi:hypothetical protein